MPENYELIVYLCKFMKILDSNECNYCDE